MNKTEELAHQLFSEQDLDELQQAIASSEKKTSGEIKLNFEYDVQQHALHHAERIFHALKLHKTAERNATLIVLFLKDRRFAILGDEGIHKRVPADFWDSISSKMEAQFRQGKLKEGLLIGIQELGAKLAEYFPPHKDDRNEISDKIEMGGHPGKRMS
jgi:uncharacterized membrane protein